MFSLYSKTCVYPVSILHKSIAGSYLPVMVADGPITPATDLCRMLAGYNAFCLFIHLSVRSIRNIFGQLLYRLQQLTHRGCRIEFSTFAPGRHINKSV